MSASVESLTSYPADLVPVAVAAFEETWRSRGNSLTLLNVVATGAREEAEFRLREAPERDSTEALTLAWGVVWPILERLLKEHKYLAETINDLIAEAAKQVTHVSESGGGP
ncbi:hypothetical protein [Actinomadura sp. 3N508]|uniref:hypothetical protein n=1 Tax=Actinomadura sp. 3N508 TaxID=3375153 RepID=UPI0037A29A8D